MRRGLMYANYNQRCSKPFYPNQQPHVIYTPQDDADSAPPDTQPDTPPATPPAQAQAQPAAQPEAPAAAEQPAAQPPKPRGTGALMAMLRQHDQMAANARKRAQEQQ